MENDKYNKNEIKKDIMKMYSSPIYQKLNNHYNRENIFSVIRKSRSENTHSDFLAWLFDSHSKHGLGIYPVEMLLRLFDIAKTKNLNKGAYLPQTYENIIFGSEYKITDVRVAREQTVKKKGHTNRPVDICIEIDIEKSNEQSLLIVVIENKVKSTEHDEQTMDYYQRMQDKYANKENTDIIYAYLTPKSNDELDNMIEQDCQCKKFIQINYQFLLDYVIQPCYERIMSAEAKIFIDNYIRCLGDTSFFDDDDESKKKENKGGVTIMAVSREENALLRKFWDENQKLIKASINSVLNDEDDYEFSDEERDVMQKAIQIDKNSKKALNFKFENQVYSSRVALVHAVVSAYVSKHPNVTYDQIKKVFPDDWGKPGFGVVVEDIQKGKAKSNFDDYSNGNDRTRFKFADPICLADGTRLVISREWNYEKNFQTFLKGIKTIMGENYTVDVTMR